MIERVAKFREKLPQFKKVPPIAKKIRKLPTDYATARENLQQIKEDPLGCLLFTVLSLKGDTSAFPDTLLRIKKGLETYEEEAEKFQKEYKKMNDRSRELSIDSHLPAQHRHEPDTRLGPESIKYLKNAMGFDPPPEPEQMPNDPKGAIAVVDGTNVVCG